MPGTIKPKKTTALARILALIAGFEKHFPGGQFIVGAVPYTTASLVARLQTLADAISELISAQLRVQELIKQLRATMADVGPDVQASERIAQASFGQAVEPLADFGLVPYKKRAPLTSEQLLLAAARARATRKARGTKSRKQRLAIKGDVSGVMITPVTAAAAPGSEPTVK